MANTRSKTDPGNVPWWRLDTTATGANAINIGCPWPDMPGWWELKVVAGGAAPGSLRLKLAARDTGLGSATYVEPVYYTATSDSPVTAGTAITTGGTYYVYCGQSDLLLDYTQDTDGMSVYLHSSL